MFCFSNYKFLATVKSDVVFFDGSGWKTLGTKDLYQKDDYLSYGIAWSNQHVYVTVKNRIVKIGKDLSPSFASGWEERGSFHQILCRHNILYAISPVTNSVVVFEIGADGVLEYVTRHHLGGEKKDKNHINSIYYSEVQKCFYLCYHNRGESHCTRVNEHSFLEEGHSPIGIENHTIFVDERTGFCYTHSSKEGLLNEVDLSLSKGHILRSLSMQEAAKQHNLPIKNLYCRGIAADERYMLVGASQFSADRSKRTGLTYVFAVDRSNFECVNFLKVPFLGALNDIRIVNKKDVAYSGTENFPLSLDDLSC